MIQFTVVSATPPAMMMVSFELRSWSFWHITEVSKGQRLKLSKPRYHTQSRTIVILRQESRASLGKRSMTSLVVTCR